jgi:hypothetical protein
VQQTPQHPWLCAAARGVAGAAGASRPPLFAVQTGNIEALNPAVLGGAAAVGFVGRVVGPKIVGGVLSGAASAATHAPEGYSPGGAVSVGSDAANGATAPAYAGATGFATGAGFGAVSPSTGYAAAGEVLTSAGTAGAALIGGVAGGLAAAASVATGGLVYRFIAPSGCQ